MIITSQKDFKDILQKVDGRSVFVVGCDECADLCHTGGREEVEDMKKKLKEEGNKVCGSVILDPACHLQNDKRLFREHRGELVDSEVVLVLACGNGVQTVSKVLDDKDVVAGLDTFFLGEISRLNSFKKQCEMCGKCIVDAFGGFCPIALCPKNMLNGPCGGSVDGKCEIEGEMDCVWDRIYKTLKKKGRVDLLKKIKPAKDWSKTRKKEV
ncbi:MAG: methylenetetrahydrofolate reductase C-terminal domain-containing protein [Candidatus Thermoplasmatota archaeon]